MQFLESAKCDIWSSEKNILKNFCLLPKLFLSLAMFYRNCWVLTYVRNQIVSRCKSFVETDELKYVILLFHQMC